jgi:hypothetical protein
MSDVLSLKYRGNEKHSDKNQVTFPIFGATLRLLLNPPGLNLRAFEGNAFRECFWSLFLFFTSTSTPAINHVPACTTLTAPSLSRGAARITSPFSPFTP